jgi:YabP family.
MPGNIKLYYRFLESISKGVNVKMAMNVKEELLFDFSINMPRLLVSGKTGILDNVKKVVFITENSIVVDHGNRFSAINGDGLRVLEIEEERMKITGEIHSIEFYSGKKGESDEK